MVADEMIDLGRADELVVLDDVVVKGEASVVRRRSRRTRALNA